MYVVGDNGAIIGEDHIPLPSEAKLIFEALNPDQKGKPLIVKSGANSIKWSYELNTVTQHTIGGEVIQVLSAYVGPMTIEGITGYPTSGWTQESYTPVDEMVEIIEWFIVYMQWAGTTVGTNKYRDERSIHFSYPARGWDFYIVPTDLQGFKIDKNVTAVPWSITAEVVSDNALEYFEATSMAKFTEPLNLTMFQRVISPGFEWAKNPFINPHQTRNMHDAAWVASKLGAEFQGLVADYSTGNYGAWGFSALGDNSLALPSPKHGDFDYQKTGGLANFWGQNPPNNKFNEFQRGVHGYWVGGLNVSDYNVMGEAGYVGPGHSEAGGGGAGSGGTGSGGTGGTTGTGKCNAVVVLGDSLSVRMASSGGLDSKLKANGWKSSKVIAQVGETVEQGIASITANKQAIENADGIIIALGTNPGPDTDQSTFAEQIQKMISAIRKINANATIWWMNAYTKVSNYPGVDGALANGSGYTLIDWKSAAKGNPDAYPFDPDGIHPSIPTGTSAQADLVAKAAACVPAPTGGSGQAGDCGKPNEIPASLWKYFTNAAAKWNISPYFLASIFWEEHGHSWPTSGPWATSPAGAAGPFQFLPSTWEGYKQDCDGDGTADIQSLADASCGAAQYLAGLGAKGICGTSDKDISALWRAADGYSGHTTSPPYADQVTTQYKSLLQSIGYPNGCCGGTGGDLPPAGGCNTAAMKAAKQVQAYIRAGKIKFNNPSAIDDVNRSANGERVHSQCGEDVCIDTRVFATMNALVERFGSMRSYALCSDHHCDGNSSSDLWGGHSKGYAFDLNEVGGVAFDGSGCSPSQYSVAKAKMIEALKFLQSYGGADIRLIAANVCNVGSVDSDINSYSIPECHRWGGEKVCLDHTNHIHVCYTPGVPAS